MQLVSISEHSASKHEHFCMTKAKITWKIAYSLVTYMCPQMLARCSQMLKKCKNAKYGSRAFQRTTLHVYWTKTHWNMWNLFCKYFCIFAKNRKSLDENLQKWWKMMKFYEFSNLHMKANSHPKCMISCAFESPWPIFCIFALCEHLRAFHEHLRAFLIHAFQKCFEKCDFFIKNVFYEHARRCSQDARRCSQNAKMQNMDQGLSNAQLCMQFRWKFAEICRIQFASIFCIFAKLQIFC